MARSVSFTVRKWHKWLSLVVGIQALLWLLSGAYMVVVNLDFIHGDHLVRKLDEPLPADTGDAIPFGEMAARYPDATEIRLVSWRGQPFYRVYSATGNRLVDAVSGEVASPLSREDAVAVARYHYTGDGPVAGAVLLTDNAPSEIQSRPLPLWQIRFEDAGAPAFYVAPDLGHLVTRRHTWWRVFDFVWMFHVMDYQERADVNNNLLRVSAALGLLLTILGLWLLFWSFRRRGGQGDSPAAAG